MASSPLDWLPEALERLEQRGVRRRLVDRQSPQGGEIVVDGQRLVNFSSNDYLGLASDPRVVEAARRSATVDGWGGGASPLVTGHSQQHRELERDLARLEHQEAALVFPSGFAANAGTIPALVGEGDVVFSDANNHASLIDGCRLSKATRVVYPHADTHALRAELEQGGDFRRRLIVTDSLFSMDGDFAPLVELGRLAEEYDAMLLVDEAHATGVWGAEGRGLVEHLAADAPELERQVTIRVGTLSKALGSCGGFVCGSQLLIDWLANTARSYVFSTAFPASMAAAAREALRIVETEPHRREQLLTRGSTLRERLAERGWDLAGSTSQIIPLVIGPADRTMAAADRLRQAGLHVPGIRPPTVAEGTARLRVSLSYAHDEACIEQLVDALGDAGEWV